MSAFIRTIKGDVPVESFGLILPHEHLFVDLRGPHTPDYAQGDPEKVAALVKPWLDAAQAAGVTAIVEPSTVGVGRNIQVLRYLANVTPIHIIAPTGIYREAYIPLDLTDESPEALAAMWVRDLQEGIDGTDSRAGWIKIAMSNNGPTDLEVRSLKAATIASQQTGAVVGSHTIGGAVARSELDILQAAGLDLHRFIWIHAQTEPDQSIHLEAARRGAWLEFDAIGAPYASDELMIEATLALIQAGYANQILLSHDAGWYEPPTGMPKDGMRGCTALVESFLPALRARGVSEETIRQITVTNPANAFALTARA